MTKYKEFMRAKGIMLQCDYAALSCSDFDMTPYTDFYDVEFLGTEVLDNGVMAAICSYINGREYAVVDRHGECCWFDHFDDVADLFRLPYDNAYVDWIINMGCDEFDVAFDIMKDMYHNDAKVRIAFNHVKAGIMDELVFYKWISDRYQTYINQ